jgi:hypothetical protein
MMLLLVPLLLSMIMRWQAYKQYGSKEEGL